MSHLATFTITIQGEDTEDVQEALDDLLYQIEEAVESFDQENGTEGRVEEE